MNFHGPKQSHMKTRCWEWTGARTKSGYGQIMVHAESKHAQYTHRKMWTKVHGPIPDGKWVLHKCDNPPCLRPSHLFLGTQQDNIHDAVLKGRVAHGIWQPSSKLTDAKVIAMRRERAEEHTPYAQLAAKFGVTFEAARRIVLGLAWTHVPGANPDDDNNRGRSAAHRRPWMFLGNVQKRVLMVLANRGPTHCKEWSAWYPMSDKQVRSAIRLLSERGLVEVNSRHLRTFKLTAKGKEVEAALTKEDDDA